MGAHEHHALMETQGCGDWQQKFCGDAKNFAVAGPFGYNPGKG
jgi:hypothetical protein